MRSTFAGVTAVLLGLLSFAGAAEAAPKLFVQENCPAPTNGSCRQFNWNAPIPVLRTFDFTAPRAGFAQVTFQGTMSCLTSQPNETFMHFETQITTTTSGVADGSGPGGLHHVFVLPRVENAATQQPRVTVNLTSTRAIKFDTGGPKHLYFRMNKVRMDPTTSCEIYSTAFTVLYLS